MKIKRCLECGAPLPVAIAGGLCSTCALQGALAAGRDAAPTTPIQRPDAPTGGWPALGRGQRFGDYELLQEIARGGMGVVYRARQISLDRIVAVKMLLPGLSGAEYLRRFRTEASSAAGLQHPHIVAIHEVGAWHGRQYLVMDYVEGRSLAQAIAERGVRSVDFEQSARWLKAVAEAVHYAHEHGILHRDLKPSNVLIDGQGQPRVTDFGLAKRLADSQLSTPDSQLTLSGQVLGSPSYMPPEQAEARRGKVSRRSDVYGLGATLYHLLTGRVPFQGETPTEVLHQVLNHEPLGPRRLNPGIPRDLETICLKCLEKEPARRYANAQMMAEELGRFLGNKPVQARAIGPAGKAWRWCRRKPGVASLVAALWLALVLGMGGVLWQWQRAERIARQETEQRLRAEANEYAFSMNVVQQALARNDLGRARALLERYLPARSTSSGSHSGLAAELRGWEWRYLWQLCQSDPHFTLGQLPHAAGALAFTADGTCVVARDMVTSEVSFWNVATGQKTGSLPAGSGTRRALALSAQGDRLGVGGVTPDGTPCLDLWEMPARRLTARLPLGAGPFSLAFSPDPRVLAVLAADHLVRVWSLEPPRLLASYTNEVSGSHRGTIAFSPDGKTLVTGDAAGRLRFIAWPAGTEQLTFQAHSEGITALAFSADGKILASGSGYADRVIRLWEVETGRTAGELVGHTAWISSLVLAPDGTTLASTSADQTVRLWNLPERQSLATFRGHLTEVYSVAFSRDGRTLVSGCKNGTLLVWNPQKRSERLAAVTLPTAVRQVAFLPDGLTFITLNADRSLAFWDAKTCRATAIPAVFGTNNAYLALAPDGNLLVTGDTTGNIRAWNLPTNGQLTNFVAHATPISYARFCANGRMLVTAAANSKTVKVWNPTSGSELATCELDQEVWRGPDDVPWTQIAVSPDGRFLAVGEASGALKVWNLLTGNKEVTVTTQKAWISSVAYSPGGHTLVSASHDGSAILYDVATWRELAVFRGHLQAIHAAAFSPDGRRLATGGGLDDAIKLWDLATGQEVCTLEGDGTLFRFTAFSPDGHTLVSVNQQGKAHLWRAAPLTDIDAIEKGLGAAP